MKTLQEIESILRDQKPILRQRFKVKEIGIFGSFVRGEQKDTSDLDLLIDFEEPIKHVPDSIREKYPEIPWRDMAGIRDQLIA